jgi:preprotein translocase subunit SecB
LLAKLIPLKIWFDNLNIKLSDAGNVPKAQDYQFGVDFTVFKKNDSDHDYKVVLDFAMSPQRDAACRYEQVSFKAVGVFSIEDDTKEDLIKFLVPGNCLVMLYGYARGAIAQITGPNPGGSLFLPSINFDQVIKNKIAAEEKSQNSGDSQDNPAE